MQNSPYRVGLILLFLFTSSTSTVGKGKDKPECRPCPDGGRAHQQHSPDNRGHGQPSWQARWPTLVATYQASGASGHQDANKDPAQSKDADLYGRRATIASEIQAHYARRSFHIGFAGAVVSFLAAAFTAWAAYAAASAARAAAGAADEAKKANEINVALFESENRPWLGVKDVTLLKSSIADYDGIRKASFEFVFIVKNFGKVPATKSFIIIEHWGEGKDAIAIRKKLQMSINERISSPTSMVTGVSVFPDEEDKPMHWIGLADCAEKSIFANFMGAVVYRYFSGNRIGITYFNISVVFGGAKTFNLPFKDERILVSPLIARVNPIADWIE